MQFSYIHQEYSNDLTYDKVKNDAYAKPNNFQSNEVRNLSLPLDNYNQQMFRSFSLLP